MHAVSSLVRRLLLPDAWATFVEARDALTDRLADLSPRLPEDLVSQRAWMDRVHKVEYDRLLDGCLDEQDRARLLAVARAGASAWLHALPADSLGTLLDDRSVRICVGLRLGANLVEPHRCRCGEPVGSLARHGLSCARSAGRRPRHAALNETLARALRTAGQPCILEPTGLLREDGKRPDGLTLIPFVRGRPLVWDATVTDSLTPSLVGPNAAQAGTAVKRAEAAKVRKYAALERGYFFSPLAFETLGGPGPLTVELISKVSEALIRAFGNKRARTFLEQRLSLDVQRGNAVAVLGTMRDWLDTG